MENSEIHNEKSDKKDTTLSSFDNIDGVDLSQDKSEAEEIFYLNKLTLSVEDALNAHPLVKDIKKTIRPPLSSSFLTSWERRNGLSLPHDLKGFYSTMNGFSLTWSLIYADDVINTGEIHINSLQQLLPLTGENLKNNEREGSSGSTVLSADKEGSILAVTLPEIQKLINSSSTHLGKLNLGPHGKAFQLNSSHPEWGITCLVYPNAKKYPNHSTITKINSKNSTLAQKQQFESQVEIWFLDHSYQWHFLAPSFTHYYRMSFFHLGLPQWEYRFTPYGLSSWAEQIFWLVAPTLLKELKPKSVDLKSDSWSNEDTVDPPEAVAPNTTLNVLNLNMFKRKKKENNETN